MEERSFASGYDKQLLCSQHQDENRNNDAFVIALLARPQKAVMKTCTLQRRGRWFDEVQYALR